MSAHPEATVLVTGATGLIGGELVRRLVARGLRPIALTRGRTAGSDDLRAADQAGLLRWVKGDLDEPGLGLGPASLRELDGVTDVVHAAACYRLSATRAEVAATNVRGTEHLLAAARRWPLRAFHHVSSIVAAGPVDGEVDEAPLSRPRRFRNPYEESKWEAERLVLDAPAPASIYRVGITVGHSASGATTKFDGPYQAFGLMRRATFFPTPGRSAALFPLVTVDLVADALDAGLGWRPPAGARRILHVIDAAAPTLREFEVEMTRRMAGHGRVWAVPAALVLLLARLPGFRRLTGLDPAALPYMVARARFRTDRFAAFCAEHRLDPARMPASYDALALRYALARGRRFRAVA